MKQKSLNFIPVAFLLLLLIPFIGWYELNWKLTTILPWCIIGLVLFICSLAWISTSGTKLKRVNGIVLLIILLNSLLFVSGIFSLKSVWEILILGVFGSIHIFLLDIAAESGLFAGRKKRILFIPIGLSIISLAGLFLFNMSLGFAWLGLVAAVIFSIIGLLAGYRSR